MEDNSRINRRPRPRPYDLRRKVLLKNFLREQMTHIPMPETRIESASQDNAVNFSEESSVSVHVDGDLSELNEELLTLPTTSENVQNSSSQCDNNESTLNVADSKDVLDTSVDSVDNSIVSNSSSSSVNEPSLFKFASLVKIKKESKKTLKGILKAKNVCKSVKSPMKTRSFKSGIERVFYGNKRPSESTSSNLAPKNSPRSLFSLFKHRKGQRNLKESPSIKISTSVTVKTSNITSNYNTSNQSVQTDDSWAREELIRVQQSNKRLKEENRLLSESLSYFMSNSSVDLHVKHCNSPLQSSNKNSNSTIFPDYYVSSSNSTSVNWNSRPRVTRSKSVQARNERKNMPRNNYRTRSMNYHKYRSGGNQVINLLPSGGKPSVSAHSAQSQIINIPRVTRKMPLTNALRSIQRRSSMPERPLSENDRSVILRRSGSFRDTHNRKPFNSLPSEAFY